MFFESASDRAARTIEGRTSVTLNRSEVYDDPLSALVAQVAPVHQLANGPVSTGSNTHDAMIVDFDKPPDVVDMEFTHDDDAKNTSQL